VLVHARVPLTFLAADLARDGARIEHLSKELLVRTGAPRSQRPGRRADIGAVQIEPDALAQLLHLVLGKAGVRAGNAGLRARVTFLDATDQCIVHVSANSPVRTDHFADLHGKTPMKRLATPNSLRRAVVPAEAGARASVTHPPSPSAPLTYQIRCRNVQKGSRHTHGSSAAGRRRQ